MIITRPFTASYCRGRRHAFLPPATEDEFSTEKIDWYAVERVVNNDRPWPRLNADELREAALALRRADMPRASVSVYLSVYERIVKDWEADAGMLGLDQLCTIDDCRKARVGRGLCTNHLAADRQWRNAIAGLGVAA